MPKTSVLMGVIIGIVAVVSAAYLITGREAPQPEPPYEEKPVAPPQQTPIEAPKKSVTVRLTETLSRTKEWAPSRIVLKKGDLVELTVINEDDTVHRLAIMDFGVQTTDILGGNGRATVTFRVDKVGVFVFKDPSTPDWDSPRCVAERELAGGEKEGEIEKALGDVKEVVSEVNNVVAVEEIGEILTRFEAAVQRLEGLALGEMVKPVADLKKVIRGMREADAIDTVLELVNEADRLLEKIKGLIKEEPVCVPLGQIVVEP